MMMGKLWMDHMSLPRFVCFHEMLKIEIWLDALNLQHLTFIACRQPCSMALISAGEGLEASTLLLVAMEVVSKTTVTMMVMPIPYTLSL